MKKTKVPPAPSFKDELARLNLEKKRAIDAQRISTLPGKELAIVARWFHTLGMAIEFDRIDYSIAVKRNKTPPGTWRWEIYCSGKTIPVRRAPTPFATMAEATRAGKAALKQFLARSIR